MTLLESTTDFAAEASRDRFVSGWFACHLGGFARRDRRGRDVARVDRLPGGRGWIWIVEGESGTAVTSAHAGAAADRVLRARGMELEAT